MECAEPFPVQPYHARRPTRCHGCECLGVVRRGVHVSGSVMLGDGGVELVPGSAQTHVLLGVVLLRDMSDSATVVKRLTLRSSAPSAKHTYTMHTPLSTAAATTEPMTAPAKHPMAAHVRGAGTGADGRSSGRASEYAAPTSALSKAKRRALRKSTLASRLSLTMASQPLAARLAHRTTAGEESAPVSEETHHSAARLDEAQAICSHVAEGVFAKVSRRLLDHRQQGLQD